MKKTIFLISLFASLTSGAQVKSKNNKLNAEDSTALQTIASYHDSIRSKVLEASRKPEVLEKAGALQNSTSQSFRNLVDKHSRQDQQKFWDLSRYPSLISEMTSGGKKSREELQNIASKYPEEIRKTIVEFGRKHYDDLSATHALYQNSQQEFQKLLANYPPKTQVAYSSLANHPDVLSTLSNNMKVTTMLGNMLKKDSLKTIHMLDSISIAYTKQKEKIIEDWKSGLENNPEAKKELEKAAREFTDEYTEGDTGEEEDDVYATSTTSKPKKKRVFTDPPPVVYVSPYPYWFGYPWWYNYPHWYPYPYWHNLGFYWGPSGIVYIGLPSPYFMHWYFYHPYHHYHYYHFSDYVLGYHSAHYGPRHPRTEFNSVVNRWAKVNESNLPRGYLNQDARRPERIKELGRFEMDYHNNTKGVFGRNPTRSEFLKNNPKYYPQINPVIKQRNFNKRIEYPQQQNPIRFNLGSPRGTPKAPVQKGGRPR